MKNTLVSFFVLVFSILMMLTAGCGKKGAGSTMMMDQFVAAPGPAATPAPALPNGMKECPASFVNDALPLINAVRAQYGAAALTPNTELMQAARQRTIDMIDSGVLSHDGWEQTLNAFGYLGTLGENIALGSSTPALVVTAWVNSPHHFQNMINPAYKESGIGCMIDRSNTMWWSQDFGAH